MTGAQPKSPYLVVETFSPASVLYRRACAQAEQASRMAAEYAQEGRNERRLREIDATISTVILVQASAESWIFHVYRRAGVKPAVGSWIQKWQHAPAMICSEGCRSLDESTTRFLRYLSLWRNFLVHGDDRARNRLFQLVPEVEVPEQLTNQLAIKMIEGMDAAFTDAGALLGVHGSPGLHSAMMWIAPGEL